MKYIKFAKRRAKATAPRGGITVTRVSNRGVTVILYEPTRKSKRVMKPWLTSSDVDAILSTPTRVTGFNSIYRGIN